MDIGIKSSLSFFSPGRSPSLLSLRPIHLSNRYRHWQRGCAVVVTMTDVASQTDLLVRTAKHFIIIEVPSAMTASSQLVVCPHCSLHWSRKEVVTANESDEELRSEHAPVDHCKSGDHIESHAVVPQSHDDGNDMVEGTLLNPWTLPRRHVVCSNAHVDGSAIAVRNRYTELIELDKGDSCCRVPVILPTVSEHCSSRKVDKLCNRVRAPQVAPPSASPAVPDTAPVEQMTVQFGAFPEPGQCAIQAVEADLVAGLMPPAHLVHAAQVQTCGLLPDKTKSFGGNFFDPGDGSADSHGDPVIDNSKYTFAPHSDSESQASKAFGRTSVQIGDPIIIDGIASRPGLNGSRGTVTDCLPNHRVGVRLSGAHKSISVRIDSVRPVNQLTSAATQRPQVVPGGIFADVPQDFTGFSFCRS